MRTAFVETLLELAREDDRIWLLTGDLGYSVLEPFREEFPDRYLNVGVAEQNMTGLAAGLASCGAVPFTYSIANFPTLRCLEQIRNDAVYHELPVRIVSVGAGYAYGPQGYTHHGIEDLAVMRALPGMTVVSPADPVETRLSVRALASIPGPAYLRLGKAGERVLHEREPRNFALGQAIELRSGEDVALVATGSVLALALDAAGLLAKMGVSARVVSMPTVKPLDEEAVRDAARNLRAIVTIEEHSIIGGLGSAVCEVVAAMPDAVAVVNRYGAADRVRHNVGSQSFLRGVADDVVAHVQHTLERTR